LAKSRRRHIIFSVVFIIVIACAIGSAIYHLYSLNKWAAKRITY
jgi:hypothetical protein